MRKISLLVLMMITFISVSAQTRTTTWPYMFEEFTKGTLTFTDGHTKKQEVNIHLLESTLHFLSGSSIMETKDSKIVSVAVNDVVYLNINGIYVLKILEENEEYLGQIYKADISSLLESGGAYGSSSNSSSVRELSSYEIGGTNNMNHMYLKQNKDQGKVLPIENDYVFIKDKRIIDARFNEVKKELGSGEIKKLKSFIKSNKLKWNDEEDLKTIFKYLVQIKE